MEPTRHFVFAVIFLVLAAAVFGAMNSKAEFGNVADWAQAIGSVAALWGVWWSTNRTIRATLEPAKQAARDRAELIWYMTSLLVSAVQMAIEVILGRLPKFSEDNFQDVRSAFEAFPLTEVPSGPMAVRVLALRRASAAFVNTYRECLDLREQVDFEKIDPDLLRSLRAQFDERAERLIKIGMDIQRLFTEIHLEVHPGKPVELPIASNVID